MKAIGNDLLRGGLSTEEQRVFAKLEPYVQNGEIEVRVHNLSKFLNRFKARLRYRNIDTPFIVVGSQVLRGTISKEVLAETIRILAADINTNLEQDLKSSAKKTDGSYRTNLLD
jgi:hypothetical protein